MRLTIDELRELANAKPARKRPRHEEDKLQMACKSWFDAQYPNLSKLLHHSPNEGLLMRRDRDGAKRKAMGVRAGFPDFVLLRSNRFYGYLAIELKTAKGRQTANQKEYERAVERSGGRYVVVRSIEGFMEVVNDYLKD